MELDAQTLPAAQDAPLMQTQQDNQQEEIHELPELDKGTAGASEPSTRLTDAASEVVSMITEQQTAQQQQLDCPVPTAAATEQVLDATMQPRQAQAQPEAHVASSQVQYAHSQGELQQNTAQVADSDGAQLLEDEQAMTNAFLPATASSAAQQKNHQQQSSSRASELTAQQGTERQALAPAAAAGKSSRRASRDKSPARTRMSLRSCDPGPIKKSRKVSSGRSDRLRSVSGARAPAYATRYTSSDLLAGAVL